MDKKSVASVVWRMSCAATFLVPVGLSYGQSPPGLVNAEAFRVNAYQKFIVANTYLFDDGAQLSYLYAYDPSIWVGAERAIGPEFRVLAPSEDTTTWWAESPYHVVDLDSYAVCADSEDKLPCIRDHGAYLASSMKHPEFKHDGLFVIKEALVESPLEITVGDLSQQNPFVVPEGVYWQPPVMPEGLVSEPSVIWEGSPRGILVIPEGSYVIPLGIEEQSVEIQSGTSDNSPESNAE